MRTDATCPIRTIGGTSRQRQLAACGVLILGAVICAVTTAASDWQLYKVLALLGATAVVAWLVDGSSLRYMGPGLAALAVGGGITAYRAWEIAPVKGEHTIVYPALGVALLIASFFHPMAIRAAGSFLVYVGFIAFIDTSWEPGWTLTGILVLWAASNLARIQKEAGDGSSVDLSEDHREASDERTLMGSRR